MLTLWNIHQHTEITRNVWTIAAKKANKKQNEKLSLWLSATARLILNYKPPDKCECTHKLARQGPSESWLPVFTTYLRHLGFRHLQGRKERLANWGEQFKYFSVVLKLKGRRDWILKLDWLKNACKLTRHWLLRQPEVCELFDFLPKTPWLHGAVIKKTKARSGKLKAVSSIFFRQESF